MSYIEPFELIFTNDQKGGIHTGGISVNSIENQFYTDKK